MKLLWNQVQTPAGSKQRIVRGGIVLLLSAILAGGCGYYHTWQLGKKNQEVQTILEDASAQQAARYLPNDYKKAQKALDDSKAAAEAGNYDEATTNSESAKAFGEQVLARLPLAKANVEEKRTVLTDVQTSLNETLKLIQDLGIAEADPEVAALIDSVSKASANINLTLENPIQVVDGEQGYDAAITAATPVLADAKTTLSRLEKIQAEKLLAKMDEDWRSAQDLEITKYVPAASQVPGQLEQARSLITSASFRAVLNQIPTVEKELDQYRNKAKEERALARIQHARRLMGIVEKEGEAEEEKLKAIKDALDEADNQANSRKFDEAFAVAENSISLARAEIKALEEELQQQIDDLQIRIDEAKKWQTEKIAEAKYKEAETGLATAKTQISEFILDQVANTVEAARDAIEEAIGDARTVQLSLRLREAENALLATEERGTYTYLKTEYQAIQDLIVDATNQVDATSYDKAEATLNDAELKTAALETGMKNLAQKSLDETEAAYQEAVAAGAEKDASDLLKTSAELLQSAQGHAAHGNWKDSLEAGGQGLAKAREAALQTYRIRTEETKPLVDRELVNAREAGAPAYASELYNLAMDAVSQSEKASQEGNFKVALQQIQEANKQAANARLFMLDRAQQLVDSAISAQAQKYDADTIASALVDLGQAREKMEQAQYEPSRQLALAAEEKARNAETKTWDARSSSALASLKDRVDQAQVGHAAQYAAVEFKTLTQTLTDSEKLYSEKKFQDAYNLADQGTAQAESVFTRLDEQLKTVRNEYDSQVNLLKTFVLDDYGLALHADATLRLGKLDDAILRKDYANAFSLYEEAQEYLKRSTAATKLHNVNTRKNLLTQQIAGYEQSGLFLLFGKTADQLRQEITAVDYDPTLDRLKPEADYYRQAIQALAQIEGDVGNLREAVTNIADERIQKVRTEIDNAREIGARDLVPQDFNSAVDSFERSRDMVYLIQNPLAGTPPVDFNQLAQLIQTAESQVNNLNQTALAQRNSMNYLRDLILWTYDMTRFLDDWYPIEDLGQAMIETSGSDSRVDVYQELQTNITAKQLLTEAERLNERIKLTTPPASMSFIHQVAMASFSRFVEAADGFYRYGLYSRYPERMRAKYLSHAFTTLEFLHMVNERLITEILKKVRAYDLIEFERDLSDELAAFSTYLRREKSAG